MVEGWADKDFQGAKSKSGGIGGVYYVLAGSRSPAIKTRTEKGEG